MKASLVILFLTFVTFVAAQKTRSLVLVTDTSASSEAQLKETKNVLKQIVERVRAKNIPMEYVLVSLNDPDFGPIQHTRKYQEFLDTIDNMKVVDQFDKACAQKSMKGLETALKNARNHSVIYTLTDADTDDNGTNIMKDAIEKAKDKNSSLHFLVKGSHCPQYRSDATYDAYDTMANGTQGSVNVLGKDSTQDLHKIVDDLKFPREV